MKSLSAMLIMVTTITLATTVPSVSPAQATDVTDANATVLHRQKVMETVGALMDTLGCVTKKECTLDDKAVTKNARGIAFMAELSLPAFRGKAEGATVKHTAKPEIWSEWAKFEGGLKAMGDAATRVATLAVEAKREQALEAIGELGKTCKGCHDTFRTK